MELREDKTDKFTIKSGHLDVGGGHKVYFEQWGNKNAKIPILYFHGGPGSRYKTKHKLPFDPNRHQVIFFDQRGIGNSLPYGKTEDNETKELTADSIKILDHLKIKKVYLYGSSWGSTLALLINIEHSKRVVANVINGVFTASRNEIQNIYDGRSAYFYPDIEEKFIASVPYTYSNNPMEYHINVLTTQKDEAKLIRSAQALEAHDLPVLTFDYLAAGTASQTKEYDYISFTILAHYLKNEYFLPANYILNHVSQIKNPLYIVQGRYDMACPPVTAYKVHKSVDGSKLFMTLGGHNDKEPENRTALKSIIETVFI
jgi:proline iminopeptidase